MNQSPEFVKPSLSTASPPSSMSANNTSRIYPLTLPKGLSVRYSDNITYVYRRDAVKKTPH